MTPTANPHRGELLLMLDDRPLLLRPTFAALSALEQQTGHSLIALARRLANGQATLKELELIITLSAVDIPPNINLDAPGILPLSEQLLAFLIAAITGEPLQVSHG